MYVQLLPPLDADPRAHAPDAQDLEGARAHTHARTQRGRCQTWWRPRGPSRSHRVPAAILTVVCVGLDETVQSAPAAPVPHSLTSTPQYVWAQGLFKVITVKDTQVVPTMSRGEAGWSIQNGAGELGELGELGAASQTRRPAASTHLMQRSFRQRLSGRLVELIHTNTARCPVSHWQLCLQVSLKIRRRSAADLFLLLGALWGRFSGWVPSAVSPEYQRYRLSRYVSPAEPLRFPGCVNAHISDSFVAASPQRSSSQSAALDSDCDQQAATPSPNRGGLVSRSTLCLSADAQLLRNVLRVSRGDYTNLQAGVQDHPSAGWVWVFGLNTAALSSCQAASDQSGRCIERGDVG